MCAPRAGKTPRPAPTSVRDSWKDPAAGPESIDRSAGIWRGGGEPGRSLGVRSTVTPARSSTETDQRACSSSAASEAQLASGRTYEADVQGAGDAPARPDRPLEPGHDHVPRRLQILVQPCPIGVSSTRRLVRLNNGAPMRRSMWHATGLAS